MEWIDNRFKNTGEAERFAEDFSRADIQSAYDFHTSMPQYESTTLHELPERAQSLGLGALYVKDESTRFGLNAFKGLGASYAMAHHFAGQLNEGIDDMNFNRLRSALKGRPPETFVTATEGNHGKGVAWGAKIFKQQGRVFLPKGASGARVQAVTGLGADAEVASHFGADVVSVPETELPGKYFACFTGSRHAGRPLLLFLDADTYFTDEHSLSRLCAQYVRDGGKGALSVQPFHQTGTRHETLSAVFNLMTVAGINIFSVFKNKYQAGTFFGPVVLTSKKDYQETGGHMAAKGYIIEGEGLYKAYTAGSMAVTHYLGKGTVHLRMYSGGFQSMVDGWKKHISLGSENTAGPVMAAIMIWLSSGLIYPIFLAYTLIYEALLLPAVLSAYFISSFQFHRLCRPLIDISGPGSLFFPVYQYFFFVVYTLSLYQIRIRKSVKWKDREIKYEK